MADTSNAALIPVSQHAIARPTLIPQNAGHGRLTTGAVPDLTAMTVPISSLALREQSYIPTALARKTVDAMHADMASLRQRHVAKLTEISAYFQNVEDDTKHKFLSFLELFRTSAHNELAAHKKALQQANIQLKEQQEQSLQRIAGLEDVLRTNQLSNVNALENVQQGMAVTEARHAEVCNLFSL
jgi:hypothetical protein